MGVPREISRLPVEEQETVIPVDIDGIIAVLNNQAVFRFALPDLFLALLQGLILTAKFLLFFY